MGEYFEDKHKLLSWQSNILNCHVFEKESEGSGRHLALRDYLRSFPEKAKEYELIKKEAAARHPHSPSEYMNEKHAVVQKLEQEALCWKRTEEEN